MNSSFSSGFTVPDRVDVSGTPVVIHQFARYPATLETPLRSGSSIGSGHGRLASKSPSLLRRETPTPRSIQSSPRAARSAIVPEQGPGRSGLSMSPPLLQPLRHGSETTTMERQESRSLPSRDVADENIDDAYVAFIFYCNPSVPSSADTAELRRAFRSPPRSDGKSFSIFTLWELIRKLDNKELKTWIQLAIELGVEPPSAQKKQSTQKVQQYAVRLKRWMRAMHVDAFFEYCLGHSHPYFTQLPPNNVLASESRDGVPLEEDLALRALVPQWKPKRGRKRAEEKENVDERRAKRPQIDTSLATVDQTAFPAHNISFPQSAIPFSPFPDDEMETNDTWLNTQTSFSMVCDSREQLAQHQTVQMQWRPLSRATSPSGYPQSAIIPRGQMLAENHAFAEPRSALDSVSVEKARSRRKHGPAVSSAWPNSNGSTTGKTRGRPPSKGPESTGSFGTFPANPARNAFISSVSRASPAVVLDQDAPVNHSQHESLASNQPKHSRPGKLQLQVPQHVGAPVRLATPPTLLVKGATGKGSGERRRSQARHESTAPANDRASLASADTATQLSSRAGETTLPTMEDLTQALCVELFRGRLVGRSAPLAGDEARPIARLMVANLVKQYSGVPHASLLQLVAVQLGLGRHFGFGPSTPATYTIKLRSASLELDSSDRRSEVGLDQSDVVYSVIHEQKLFSGMIAKTTFGHFAIKSSDTGRIATVVKPPNTTDNDDNNSMNDELDSLIDDDFDDDISTTHVSEATWKQRYLRLRGQMQKKERSLTQYKRKILESVMADL